MMHIPKKAQQQLSLSDNLLSKIFQFQAHEDRIKYAKTFQDSVNFNIVKNSFCTEIVDLSKFSRDVDDNFLRLFSLSKKIILTNCDQITDQGLPHLKTVPTIIFRNCPFITDNGLAGLKSVPTLKVSDCSKVINPPGTWV
tara:strand:- start:2467 stop:2886 length:420 start_codon:yes stop_codon:yes gene_type:complete